MPVCELKTVLEILTAMLAIGAAGWWFAAAWVSRLPPTWDSLNTVARKQAIYNGIAASCAGLAATLQLIRAFYVELTKRSNPTYEELEKAGVSATNEIVQEIEAVKVEELASA